MSEERMPITEEWMGSLVVANETNNREDPAKWEQILFSATQEVMETMFFSTVIGQAADGLAIGDSHTAQLRFRGNPSGIFSVSVSRVSARQIAANFIGAEDPDELTANQIEDVVGEMANMLCGSVLSGVRTGAHFDLTHPQLLQDLAEPPAGAISSHLELEDGIITSWLKILDGN